MDDRLDISDATVRALLRRDAVDLADLPLERLVPGGWDNRSFRLGDGYVLRFPAAARYAAQVAREARWLPVLAPKLPLAVPQTVCTGCPGFGYPFPWAVRRWIEGTVAGPEQARDPAFAATLADGLTALQGVPSEGGPAPGVENFHRGGELRVYRGETAAALDRIGASGAGGASVWATAEAADAAGQPRWVHGDVAPSNLLLRRRRLVALIDFGQMAVGDPACDLTIAWTFFEGPARQVFMARMDASEADWARARGWALWKAAITLAGGKPAPPGQRAAAAVLADVIAEHRAG